MTRGACRDREKGSTLMSHAVLVRQTGGPEVLVYEDYDPGPPAAGAARIKVTASGINFIDVYFRSGLYPSELPSVVGREGAGVVEAVGAGVDRLAAGDRVCWALVPGSYAEVANVPADRLVAILWVANYYSAPQSVEIMALPGFSWVIG